MKTIRQTNEILPCALRRSFKEAKGFQVTGKGNFQCPPDRPKRVPEPADRNRFVFFLNFSPRLQIPDLRFATSGKTLPAFEIEFVKKSPRKPGAFAVA
ncbi:hypothetical protein [Roseibium sp.]|uniref:hypothetical protein n=1 Tax=Roseibium sp. TaxID=1936156 RepID=UPI003D0F47FE